MARVKVKVVKEFRDSTADLELRKNGEVLTVSEERADKLIGLGLATRTEVEEPIKTEPQKNQKKRTIKQE